jgi:glycosyltransferase involved in cell wall biosynthesis
MRDKRVLIISLLFPPLRNVGVIRTEKMVKYLPEYGWEPTVLTAKYSPKYDLLDTETKELPNIKVIRARFIHTVEFMKSVLGLDPLKDVDSQVFAINELEDRKSSDFLKRMFDVAYRYGQDWLAFPDRWNTWIPFAFMKGCIELNTRKYDLIHSTTTPTNHIVGYMLSSLFNLPWIADYQDAWTQFDLINKGHLRMGIEKVMERTIIRRADYMTAVSEQLLELLLCMHQGKRGRSAVITNGFDPEDFRMNMKPGSDRLVLTYTGYMYGMERDPRPLMRAITRLIDKRIISEKDILVRFYTPWEPRLNEVHKELKYRGIMEVHDSVPRSEAILRQMESTALINLMLDGPLDLLGHGAKIFEYFGAKRPVLVWSPLGGPIKDLVEETNTGAVATNEWELEAVLMRWISEFKKDGELLFQGNEEQIEKYSYVSLTKRLSEILDSVCVK